MNMQDFYTGHAFDAYEFFGAHTYFGGTHFAVWAPSAQHIAVETEVGTYDMHRTQSAVWECDVPGANAGMVYQYWVRGANGQTVAHCDPYGTAMTLRPDGRSIIADRPTGFTDDKWMAGRTKCFDKPLNIYEVHAGSWRQKEDGSWYTYAELAELLPAYCKENGFTHIELMPLAEHPFDGSWGYQITGFYAPTSRYGTPQQLAEFVNACHKEGIGVILDFVPVHFAIDSYGLKEFDGTPLYEDPDPLRGEHPEWGTYVFNFGRREVRNFLVANALFWLEDLHFDALRVDAVSSMLYLDYSREPGHWRPNIYGGRENLEAIDFLKEATATAYKNNPGVMVIAEESTAWPGITAPTSAGGIGFGMKWNMGWMHDTLEYLHEEPINRKWHHNEITFSMVYAYSEHYVLPISHDEVVYGKGSLYGKMPGDDWQKLAGVRSMFAYQWAHPGKKLSFMGNELAQWGEWDHDASIDWDCLNWQEHRQVQTMVADLNAFYKAHPALWSQDFDPAGFQWLTSDDADHNTLSFLRIGTKGETLAVVVNFSGEAWSDYQVALPTGGKWTEVFTTDDAKYGGSDIHNGTFEAVEGEYHSRPFSAKITVPALGVVFLKPED